MLYFLIIDEVKGIDGFTGEIFVEGEVLIAFVVFEIIFVLEGVPIADFRQAQLGNLPEYFTITLYTSKHVFYVCLMSENFYSV